MEDRVDGVTNKVAQLLKKERGCEILNHFPFVTVIARFNRELIYFLKDLNC